MLKNKSSLHILLVGPVLSGVVGGVGGGAGGIVSTALRMINFFQREKINFTYHAYGVRQQRHLWFLFLVIRFIVDVEQFILTLVSVKHPSFVHIFVNGGPAVVRSAMFVLLARLWGLKVVSDIRGNALSDYALGQCGFLSSKLWQVIISLSSFILVQSKETSNLLENRFGSKIIYHPNWLADYSDTVQKQHPVLYRETIHVAFAGYNYTSKGVFDIVIGCSMAANNGISIKLTLIGEEEDSFKSFLDQFTPPTLLEILRLGRLPQPSVQAVLHEADIFLFPSYHASEGHPNVINEAMRAQLIIVTTKVGTIPEFLSDDSAYFISPRSPEEIANTLLDIQSNRQVAIEKSVRAHAVVRTEFSEQVVLGNLIQLYQVLSSSGTN